MAERSMNEVMEGIAHLIDDIDGIPRAAFETYRRYSPEVLVELDTRAAAACIYAHMVAEADRRWIGRRGIKPIDVRGLKVWLISDIVVLRWKKMDEDGRSRNYPTKQAQDFDRGKPLPGLPPPAIRITAGYLLDPPKTGYERTQIAKPRGSKIEWCVAIVPATVSETQWVDVTREPRFG